MRKALIGILLATTITAPLAAQASEDGLTERYRRQGERNAARAEQREQRQVQREQPQTQREQRQVQRAERRQDSRTYARPAAPQQIRTEVRQDRAGWRGDRRDSRQDAYRERIRQTREASRRSADETVAPGYARQAARNQERYERDLRERRDDRRDWRQDRRAGRGDWREPRREWRRDWRNDRRYDWQRYRFANRSIFTPGPYYSPYRGQRYNRFSIGLFLGSGFYSNRYWINDPWQYRLPEPYPDTQWVRYYNDVMLVDVYTGEILDVIYDFFW